MKKNLGNKTVVAPLPVFIIATYDENDVPNAMNAAWGTQCGYHEVTFLLGPHKTTDNLMLKRAFTLSFASPETMLVADYFGVESGNNVNKIEKAGVHVTKSEFVDAPVIEEFPLTLECEVIEMEEEDGDYRVVGRVVNMAADESVLDEIGNVDLGKLRPISYDGAAHVYRVLGDQVGRAFHDGLALKK